MKSDNNKWYTQLTVYGNDKKYKYNAELCQIIASIYENVLDLETYAISKDLYDMQKDKLMDYYKDMPLTQKSFEELSREERMKRHLEYLNSLSL